MIKCELCDKEFANNLGGQLTNHLLNDHQITMEEYIIITAYNNVPPKCQCGNCLENPSFVRGKFLKFAVEHNTFKLKRTFESLENFRKAVRLDSTIIFLDNKTNKDRIEYLSTEHRDVYKKFIEDSYSELKKEFKNVIPTKELKYGKEK